LTSFVAHPADLDPSRLAGGTYVTRRRLVPTDAGAILSTMLCLLMLLPAQIIVPGMTDVGRPALVMCVFLFGWWVLVRLNPGLVMVGPQPLRWAILVLALSIMVSYVVGLLRGLTTMEANSADRWLLLTAALAGATLTAADGLLNWARLKGLLAVFVWCAAFMSVLGLIQVAFFVDVSQYIVLPGLEFKGTSAGLELRGAAVRVASTATHYIEFSTVMAIALPFGIHFARFAPSRRLRRSFTVAAFLIALAIPATVSRTGIIAAAVALLVTMPFWPWRMRFSMAVFGVGIGAVLVALKPGMAGTLSGMFTGAADDPSITSRIERYAMVDDYFMQRPWLGRGTGTWVSPQYQYLDNQWFAFALTNGLLGVVALLAVHITGITLAGVALRRSRTVEDRHLCAALIATQLIAIVVGLTFDSLSFTTYAVVWATMLGLCGTVWRFTHPARAVRTRAAGLARPGRAES